jgi:hypothetical protein
MPKSQPARHGPLAQLCKRWCSHVLDKWYILRQGAVGAARTRDAPAVDEHATLVDALHHALVRLAFRKRVQRLCPPVGRRLGRLLRLGRAAAHAPPRRRCLCRWRREQSAAPSNVQCLARAWATG